MSQAQRLYSGLETQEDGQLLQNDGERGRVPLPPHVPPTEGAPPGRPPSPLSHAHTRFRAVPSHIGDSMHEAGRKASPETAQGSGGSGATDRSGAEDAEAPQPEAKNSNKALWPESMNGIESLDYELNENGVYRGDIARQTGAERAAETVLLWALITVVGVLTALAAYVVGISVENIAEAKFRAVGAVSRVSGFLAWLLYCLFNGALVGFAACMVAYVGPAAAGSGIPDVKAYLNGIDVPGVLLFRTLVAKVLGSVGSVAGGLAVGKEGPFVHTGACVASLLGNAGGALAELKHRASRRQDRGGASGARGQGGAHGALASCVAWCGRLPGADLVLRTLQKFKMDGHQRELVTCGGSAGVAAAFRAPVGGVLFALEEGASFWSNPLLWRAFYTTAVVVVALRGLLKACSDGACGYFGGGGFIIFEIRDGQAGFGLHELAPLVVLGVTGGLMGSLFTAVNGRLCVWRRDVLSKKYPGTYKIYEAVAVAVVTATLSYVVPMTASCLPCPEGVDCSEGDVGGNYVRFSCDQGHYNPLATLFFTTQDNAIRNLFSSKTEHEFPVGSLVSFFVFFYLLAILTYGVSIPSGLFVPCILCGASYGRIMGIFMSDASSAIDEGTYALLGAASFLGGTMRMTVSLCVILLELTNNLNLLALMMLVLLVAKAVGDATGVKGIYDYHIDLKRLPLLEAEPERFMQSLTAKDLASAPVLELHRFERVSDLLRSLEETTSNGFPVVEVGPHGRVLLGVVLRQHVLYSVADGRSLQDAPGADPAAIDRAQSLVFSDLCKPTSTAGLGLHDLTVTAEEGARWLDLAPLVNPCPYVVQSDTSLTKVYSLFRTLGLRHLCVVPPQNQVVGILTRKDLLAHTAEQKLHAKLHNLDGPSRRGERESGGGGLPQMAGSATAALRGAGAGLGDGAHVPSTPALHLSGARRDPFATSVALSDLAASRAARGGAGFDTLHGRAGSSGEASAPAGAPPPAPGGAVRAPAGAGAGGFADGGGGGFSPAGEDGRFSAVGSPGGELGPREESRATSLSPHGTLASLRGRTGEGAGPGAGDDPLGGLS